MAFTFTTPGLGPADYGRKSLGGFGSSTAKWGDTFKPQTAFGGSTVTGSAVSPLGPEAFAGSQAMGTGQQGYGSIYGPISAGLQLAQGVFQFRQYNQMADAYGTSYKDLMARSGQVLEQGLQTAIDIRQEGGRFIGSQMAAFGKSGSAFEGSPVSVVIETQRRIDQAAERTVEQARRDQAALYRQAKQAKKQEKSAKLAGIGSLIGSGGAAAGLLFGGPFAAIGMLGAAGFGLAATS